MSVGLISVVSKLEFVPGEKEGNRVAGSIDRAPLTTFQLAAPTFYT